MNKEEFNKLYETLKKSKFRQQKFPGWRPLPTISCITIIFISAGVFFIIRIVPFVQLLNYVSDKPRADMLAFVLRYWKLLDFLYLLRREPKDVSPFESNIFRRSRRLNEIERFSTSAGFVIITDISILYCRRHPAPLYFVRFLIGAVSYCSDGLIVVIGD